MYFVPKPKQLRRTKTKLSCDDHDDNLTEGIINIKVDFFNKWFRHSRAGEQYYDKKEMFQKAEKRVKEDMSIFNIIQTISKLKVSVAELVGRDKDIIKDIKHTYLKN